MSDLPGAAGRPLSPHLQIYRPMLTMMMSIVHRITGVALYFGTLLLVWWLVAAATSPAAFDLANAVLGSILGRIVLLGFSWALIHHALGGLRHFIWDTGHGFGPVARERLAQFSLAGSITLTVLLWVGILVVKG